MPQITRSACQSHFPKSYYLGHLGTFQTMSYTQHFHILSVSILRFCVRASFNMYRKDKWLCVLY